MTLSLFITQTLFEVSVGIALHFNNIVQAINACNDTDRYCKAEKFIQYITTLLGISRPAMLLGTILKNLANRLWQNLQGRILVEDESGWKGTILGTIIYVLMEWILQPAWEWVGHASMCLKDEENCEDRDDIIVWFMNMKLRYCQLDDDIEVSMDIEDDSVDELTDWCILLFNEGPLLIVTFVIWIAFLLSLAIEDDGDPPPNDGTQAPPNNGNLPPPPANPPPPVQPNHPPPQGPVNPPPPPRNPPPPAPPVNHPPPGNPPPQPPPRPPGPAPRYIY